MKLTKPQPRNEPYAAECSKCEVAFVLTAFDDEGRKLENFSTQMVECALCNGPTTMISEEKYQLEYADEAPEHT